MLDSQQRILSHTETFSPVLIATILVCLGWVLVLPPHIDPINNLQTQFPGLNFEALKFAFFGAYGFTLLDLVRRYFRDDLRAGAYLGMVVRIIFVGLIVTASAVLLEGAPIAFDPPGPIGQQTISISVVAFVIGFFPQAGLQLMIDTVQRATGWLFPTLRTTHPLSEIDGLNIWYETRLTEEGIDDMQNLASANFVDLMLKTRAPISRLVDWMDQAYLALHLWPTSGSDDSGARRSSAVRGLRGLGIRTATDLEEVWAARSSDKVFGKLISRALGVEPRRGPGHCRGGPRQLPGGVKPLPHPGVPDVVLAGVRNHHPAPGARVGRRLSRLRGLKAAGAISFCYTMAPDPDPIASYAPAAGNPSTPRPSG